MFAGLLLSPFGVWVIATSGSRKPIDAFKLGATIEGLEGIACAAGEYSTFGVITAPDQFVIWTVIAMAVTGSIAATRKAWEIRSFFGRLIPISLILIAIFSYFYHKNKYETSRDDFVGVESQARSEEPHSPVNSLNLIADSNCKNRLIDFANDVLTPEFKRMRPALKTNPGVSLDAPITALRKMAYLFKSYDLRGCSQQEKELLRNIETDIQEFISVFEAMRRMGRENARDAGMRTKMQLRGSDFNLAVQALGSYLSD